MVKGTVEPANPTLILIRNICRIEIIPESTGVACAFASSPIVAVYRGFTVCLL